ncbi:MAG TPA: asparagine synthase (glutamine-hydrolyzing) [Solirubrobacteraceae bacterium]|jgi:asparagine synthase (glutamine-hydrolysing)|nr:asparagine synthase (glutamine-hydrolyzing) [Solirubrobacteraceae bacterium]
MCGICGILAFSDGFACDERVTVAMRDAMIHRGPDDAGVWVSPGGRVALGHRRLSIVDVSHSGHQPMCNEDGSVWVAFNGEIYNHAQLRSELEERGHRYRSHCDTETIVHLYEEEGVRCTERLDGMFALAVWDERRRELLLARDRLGKKPLYWTRTAAGVTFASEIKALLRHPAVSADLDVGAFHDYLTFVCTPAPSTMFAGIGKLAPAERVTVGADGNINSEIYWSPMSSRAAEEVAGRSEDELGERLLELLRASIAKRMMSDVPFGVFLSGGVDSSTNVALMAELTSEPVRTFSVAFHEQERYNELEYARQIARRFGTDHREVVIDSDDLVSFLPEMVHHQDEPIADWVCVPLYYVSRLARDSGTIVVQVGEGSDEIFHGYQNYIDAVARRRRYWEPFQRAPAPLRRLMAGSALELARLTGRGVPHAQYIADAAAGRLPFWGGAICYTGELKRQILNGAGDRPDAYRIVERLWEQAERDRPAADLLQKMTYLELKQRLAELLLMRVDKMTMATSVEARVPFLDHQLVEFAMALPMDMKVRDGVGKWLLKRTVDGLLPSEIVYRKKQGFGAPVAEWFRGSLGTRAQREIRDSSLAERGLLDYARIDDLWDAHRSGRADWSFQLWNLYNVSAWHDHWVAGRD